MNQVEKGNLTRRLPELWDREASDYESMRGHGFTSPEEEFAWRADVLEAVDCGPGSICLDIAAGTGVFTRLLAEWIGPTGHVVAIDQAPEMLAKNRELLPPELRSRVSFVLGDAHDSGLLNSVPHQTFDFITCRQGLICFVDPLAIFKQWFQWLNVGGKVVILEGLWTRREWSVGDWGTLIDQLPLSCVQTLAIVPYLLQQAGFVVDQYHLLARVNAWFESTQSDFDCPRYIVVASKPS